MVEEAVETRIKSSPSLGAKISLLVAALFVVAAVYQMVVPLQVIANNGGNFDCRSAIQGPRTTLAKSTCSDVYAIATTKSIALGVGAVVLAVGGFLAFGLDRREQRVVVRRHPDGDLLDDALLDEPSPDERSHDDEAAHSTGDPAAESATGSSEGGANVPEEERTQRRPAQPPGK